MTQEFRTFTQRLTDEPSETTRIFNVQAKTIVDRFGNDVVDSKGNKIWFPVTFDPAAAIAFGRSLASKSTSAASLEFRRNVKEGGPWDLQRSYNGQSNALFASLFTNAASYAYGLIGAAAGFSQTTLMAAAGMYNVFNNPKTAGPNFGNNPNNPPFIAKGVRDYFGSSYGPPATIPDNSFQGSPALATPVDRFKTAFDRPFKGTSDDFNRLAGSEANGNITPSVGFADPTNANRYAGSFPQAMDDVTSSGRDGWLSSMLRNGEVERIMRDNGIAQPPISALCGLTLIRGRRATGLAPLFRTSLRASRRRRHCRLNAPRCSGSSAASRCRHRPFRLRCGLPDNSDGSGDGNSFNFLAGLAFQNSTQPAPPQQTGSKPVRSLGRRIVNQSPASMVDIRAPAVPLAPSDDPNFSGGLLGRLAALARIDPPNPNQPAPPPLDDEQEQADIRALDAKLSSSGNIWDAVALYNARKSSRR